MNTRRITAVRCVLTVLIAIAALRPEPARANSAGITGRSGRGQTTCTECHGGGVEPGVAFMGPSEMTLGEMATFRFEVQANGPNQRAGGLDLAADGGSLAIIPGQGARLIASVGEITHNSPKRNDDNGVAGWDFIWTAPDTPGTYTLFGAGNSVNLNGQFTGDRSSTTTFQIVVSEQVEVPTATPTPTEGPATGTPTAIRTIGPVPCVGDCDDGGSVTVNELVVGVNIVLGSSAIATCTPFDADSSGSVTINELIAGVNAALGVCL